MAVQAQPGFEPQRVACTQADRLDFRLCQQGSRQRFSLRRWNGNLEPVFTRVATAGHKAVAARHREAATTHEHQLVRAGRKTLQGGDGLGSLQGQQRHLGHGNHLAARVDFLLDVGDIARLAGAIDDDEQVAAVRNITVEEHQVIDDAARIVQQEAVALPAGGQVHHIDRNQGFKCRGCIRPHQAQLAHVRHIKQPGGSARVKMLGHQALGVLHRHGIAGKGHHARAQFYVQVMQRRFQKHFRVNFGFSERVGGQSVLQGASGIRGTSHQLPLLSCLPERFTRRYGFAPSVGRLDAGLSPVGNAFR